MTGAGDELAGAETRDQVRARRVRNWDITADVMSGRTPRPIAVYPVLALEDVRQRISASSSGPMIVSAHFSTYFLLLDLAPQLDLPFLVLTSQEGVAFWRENQGAMPGSVKFASELTPADMRACRQRRCVLFCMADFASSGLANAYVPMLGRLHYVSIAWAKIAIRMACDVYPVIAHQVDQRLDVLIDHVPSGETGAYALAARVIHKLDDFMKVDPGAWELSGLFAESYPIPEDYDAEPARREMLLLAQSDVGIRSALRSALAHGGVA